MECTAFELGPYTITLAAVAIFWIGLALVAAGNAFGKAIGFSIAMIVSTHKDQAPPSQR